MTPPALTRSDLERLLAFALEHALVGDVQLAIRAITTAGAPAHEVLAAALARTRLNRSYLRAAFEWGARYGLAPAIERLADDPRPEVHYALPHARAEARGLDAKRAAGDLPDDVRAFDERQRAPTLTHTERLQIETILRPDQIDDTAVVHLLLHNPARAELISPALQARFQTLSAETLLDAAGGAVAGNEGDASAAFLARLVALDDPRAETALLDLATHARTLEGRQGGAMALAAKATPACIARLIDWTTQRPEWFYRAIERVPRDRVVAPLLEAYRERAVLRRTGARWVAALCGEVAIPALVDALADPLRGVREPAMNALVALGASATTALLDVLARRRQPAFDEAARALAALGGPESRPLLESLARDRQSALRRLAVESLARLAGSSSPHDGSLEALFVDLLDEPDRALRWASARALAACFDSVDALVTLLATMRRDPPLRAMLYRRLLQRSRERHAHTSAALLAVLALFVEVTELREPIVADTKRALDSARLESAWATLLRRAGELGVTVDAAADAAYTRWGEALREAETPEAQARQQQAWRDARLAGADLSPMAASPDETGTYSLARGPDAPGPLRPFDAGRVREPVADSPATLNAPTLDADCYFTATAPEQIAAGAAFIVDLWCHPDDPLRFMHERRAELAGLAARSVGPIGLARGSVLDVELRLPGFEIDEPHATMRWNERTGSVAFGVRAPATLAPGSHLGSARLSVNALPIATVHFQIRVAATAAGSGAAVDCVTQVHLVRSAFASYSSQDRDAVLALIQGMLVVRPDLDVYLDVAALRSGADWQQQLIAEIDRRDRLFLFWSRMASVSPHVDFEWRHSLRTKGVGSIEPVALETSDLARPPAELAHLHFGSWTLHYRARAAADAAGRQPR